MSVSAGSRYDSCFARRSRKLFAACFHRLLNRCLMATAPNTRPDRDPQHAAGGAGQGQPRPDAARRCTAGPQPYRARGAWGRSRYRDVTVAGGSPQHVLDHEATAAVRDEHEVAVGLKLGVEPTLQIIGRLWDRGPLPGPGRVRERNDVEVQTGLQDPLRHTAPSPATVPGPHGRTPRVPPGLQGKPRLWTSPHRLELGQGSVLMSG